jgi:hypothetical protein
LEVHGDVLDKLAKLIDGEKIKSTVTKVFDLDYQRRSNWQDHLKNELIVVGFFNLSFFYLFISAFECSIYKN